MAFSNRVYYCYDTVNLKREFDRLAAAAAVPLVLLLACGGGDPQNASPPAPDLPEWEVSSEPLLTIGIADGDSSYQFFQASAGLRLEDGTIVVANTGTNELRFYDADGRFLRTVGRLGGGPGEFQGLTSVYSLNRDTLTTLDRAMRRSYFDSEGRLLGSINLEIPGETDYPALVWLYRSYWVDGVAPGEERMRFARYLDRLPPLLGDPAYWPIPLSPKTGHEHAVLFEKSIPVL